MIQHRIGKTWTNSSSITNYCVQYFGIPATLYFLSNSDTPCWIAGHPNKKRFRKYCTVWKCTVAHHANMFHISLKIFFWKIRCSFRVNRVGDTRHATTATTAWPIFGPKKWFIFVLCLHILVVATRFRRRGIDIFVFLIVIKALIHCRVVVVAKLN